MKSAGWLLDKGGFYILAVKSTDTFLRANQNKTQIIDKYLLISNNSAISVAQDAL
jgi:hypothetical protein